MLGTGVVAAVMSTCKHVPTCNCICESLNSRQVVSAKVGLNGWPGRQKCVPGYVRHYINARNNECMMRTDGYAFVKPTGVWRTYHVASFASIEAWRQVVLNSSHTCCTWKWLVLVPLGTLTWCVTADLSKVWQHPLGALVYDVDWSIDCCSAQ